MDNGEALYWLKIMFVPAETFKSEAHRRKRLDLIAVNKKIMPSIEKTLGMIYLE